MRSRQVTVKKRIFVSVFAVAACLFFFACGIPVYYVIEPPQADHIPTADTGDISQRYFSFICPYSSSTDNSEFLLQGTEIYYKIYDTRSDMDSDISNISGRNTEYSEDGYRRMTELGYKEMRSSTGDTPIIRKITSTRTIRVRLSTEGAYSAEIYDETNNQRLSVPMRIDTISTAGGNKSFTFTSNYKPSPDDSDTRIRSTEDSNNGPWYINLYAVSVGRDLSFAQHYSSVLHLGNLEISMQ